MLDFGLLVVNATNAGLCCVIFDFSDAGRVERREENLGKELFRQPRNPTSMNCETGNVGFRAARVLLIQAAAPRPQSNLRLFLYHAADAGWVEGREENLVVCCQASILRVKEVIAQHRQRPFTSFRVTMARSISYGVTVIHRAFELVIPAVAFRQQLGDFIHNLIRNRLAHVPRRRLPV